METKQTFLASNLRHLRNNKGTTQQEIANLCNKQNTAIANWEKGIREPNAVDLAILSNYFDVSINDLLEKDLRFNDIKEHEVKNDFLIMKEILIKKGFIERNESFDEKDYECLLDFIKANKQFIIKK